MDTPPSIAQQRALAYAPKPFAALSFLSAIYVIHYLLIRQPERRKRMYHRLILATFLCILPLSICIFWGTWAMPEGSPYVVGASGTTQTCSTQGFFLITFWLAFPFYYSSLSVMAFVAVKNNFQEEKYQWMEKWIHVGAYIPPLILASVAAAKDYIHPAMAFCSIMLPTDCTTWIEPSCDDESKNFLTYAVMTIILLELTLATSTMLYLWCKFEKIQKDADNAIGMKRVLESARKRRLKEVAIQTGLYLYSFWFGYAVFIPEALVWAFSKRIVYNLIIVAHCMTASQGITLMIIYYILQKKPSQATDSSIEAQRNQHDTVSKIRLNAARPTRLSFRSQGRASLDEYSFRIFDGEPAEDSPWAQYFSDGSEISSGLNSITETEEESRYQENSLVAHLLEEDELGHEDHQQIERL